MAEQAVREQQIYQTRDPLTKAEEQLFEGTLSDKKNEEQPVFSETKQEIAEQRTAEYLKTAVDSEGNRKQIEQNKNVISEEIRSDRFLILTGLFSLRINFLLSTSMRHMKRFIMNVS